MPAENFNFHNSIPAFLLRACISEGNATGGAGGVITPCLVYELVIYSPSALYVRGNIPIFQKLPCHFRNNWPVICAELSLRPVG